MKLSRFRPALVALLCGSGLLHADIVVLKDGKRLEGQITAENPTSIHMKYKLTAKIWDDKDILRSEIAEIIKQKPEEVELIELKKAMPTPDLMTAEKYETLIQERLRPFVNRYPGTPEAKEAEKLIAEVQAEKEKVVAGGMKVKGEWLTADDVKAQTYNIRAYGIYLAMRDKMTAKDYAGALKEFEKLSPPQNAYGSNSQGGYFASIYYPKAVEDALTVLTSYDGQVQQMLKDQPALQKMREDSFKKLIEPDLSRTRTAIEKEIETWRANQEQERKTSRWFAPYKYDLSSLQALSSAISNEKARLKQVDTAKITKVNDAIARLMVADAKAAKDKEALKTMGEAILEGETAATALDQQTAMSYSAIFQGYRQRYAASQAALNAASAPAPAAANTAAGSSAIGGTATPGVDARAAAALAAAGGASAVQTQPAPGAPGAMPQAQGQGQQGTAPAPGAVAPQQGGVPPQGAAPAPGVQPQAGYPAAQQQQQQPQAGYPAQQPQQQAPYAQQPAPVAATEEPAPEGMSQTTMLLIGLGVVVLVLIVAMSGGKKKKKEAE